MQLPFSLPGPSVALVGPRPYQARAWLRHALAGKTAGTIYTRNAYTLGKGELAWDTWPNHLVGRQSLQSGNETNDPLKSGPALARPAGPATPPLVYYANYGYTWLWLILLASITLYHASTRLCLGREGDGERGGREGEGERDGRKGEGERGGREGEGERDGREGGGERGGREGGGKVREEDGKGGREEMKVGGRRGLPSQ